MSQSARRMVVVQWPGAVTLPASPEPDLPTSEAVAMLRFLLARLREEEIALRGAPEPDLQLARRIGATRSLAEAWLDCEDPDRQGEVEGWDRGFADGILLGLYAAAYPYRDHPDWSDQW